LLIRLSIDFFCAFSSHLSRLLPALAVAPMRELRCLRAASVLALVLLLALLWVSPAVGADAVATDAAAASVPAYVLYTGDDLAEEHPFDLGDAAHPIVLDSGHTLRFSEAVEIVGDDAPLWQLRIDYHDAETGDDASMQVLHRLTDSPAPVQHACSGTYDLSTRVTCAECTSSSLCSGCKYEGPEGQCVLQPDGVDAESSCALPGQGPNVGTVVLQMNSASSSSPSPSASYFVLRDPASLADGHSLVLDASTHTLHQRVVCQTVGGEPGRSWKVPAFLVRVNPAAADDADKRRRAKERMVIIVAAAASAGLVCCFLCCALLYCREKRKIEQRQRFERDYHAALNA
jgi:hypothetical protein